MTTPADVGAGDAQPTGDGAPDTTESGSPWGAVLEAVPYESREAVEAALKEVEGKTTQRFQQAAEYRKQWEPYEQAGLSAIPAEDLAGAMNFLQVLSDPELLAQELANPESAQGLEAWWATLGEQAGWFAGDDDGGEDDGGGEVADPHAEEIQQLKGVISQLLSKEAERESEGRVEAAKGEYLDALSAIEEEHGELDEEARDDIWALTGPYAELPPQEAVQRAFQRYQGILGNGERGLVNGKLDAPEPPVQGGRPDTSPRPITSIREATAIAKERLNAG